MDKPTVCCCARTQSGVHRQQNATAGCSDLRHALEAPGQVATIAVTCDCELCNVSLLEDFLWLGSVRHDEKKRNTKTGVLLLACRAFGDSQTGSFSRTCAGQYLQHLKDCVKKQSLCAEDGHSFTIPATTMNYTSSLYFQN